VSIWQQELLLFGLAAAPLALTLFFTWVVQKPWQRWSWGLVSVVMAVPVLLVLVWRVEWYMVDLPRQKAFLNNVLVAARAGQTEVRLADVTPFEWTHMCYVGPYSSLADDPLLVAQAKYVLGDEVAAQVVNYSAPESGAFVYHLGEGTFMKVWNPLWRFRTGNPEYLKTLESGERYQVQLRLPAERHSWCYLAQQAWLIIE